MSDAGRRVVFDGCLNFRDLGGLPASGAVVRRGRLYRSDSLHALTRADLDRLHGEVGIRTVIDLRMAEERDEHGPRPGHFRDHVQVLHHPLFTAVLPEWTQESGWASLHVGAERYLAFLESGGDAVVQIVRAVGDPDMTPAVMHCQSGRDRTGIVAAVVLDVLGVDRDVIAADYEVTGRYVLDFEVAAERIIRMLDLVDERYGSVEEMLRRHGLTDADLAALRTALLDADG